MPGNRHDSRLHAQVTAVGLQQVILLHALDMCYQQEDVCTADRCFPLSMYEQPLLTHSSACASSPPAVGIVKFSACCGGMVTSWQNLYRSRRRRRATSACARRSGASSSSSSSSLSPPLGFLRSDGQGR